MRRLGSMPDLSGSQTKGCQLSEAHGVRPRLNEPYVRKLRIINSARAPAHQTTGRETAWKMQAVRRLLSIVGREKSGKNLLLRTELINCESLLQTGVICNQERTMPHTPGQCVSHRKQGRLQRRPHEDLGFIHSPQLPTTMAAIPEPCRRVSPTPGSAGSFQIQCRIKSSRSSADSLCWGV